MIPSEKSKNKLLQPSLQKIIFVVLAILCLTPIISAPIALVLGFLMTLIIGNPYEITTQKLTNILLQISVVGLGFGMSIFSVLILGFVLTKIFKIDSIIGYLISAGTAICGGSAIAAIAPIVKAKPNQISIALGVVFTLNSVALLVFPAIGNWLHMSQHDFGLWCAIAIHDTSSVVGAANKYGAEALQVATTVKLARALWIIPLSLITAVLFKNNESKIKIPWFIGYFILAICLNTYFPLAQKLSPFIVNISKAGLTLTLFFIGAGLSLKIIQNIGIKPLVMAVVLWLFISFGALWMILK